MQMDCHIYNMTYRARASPKHKNPRGGIPPGLIGLRRHGHPGRSVVVPVKVVVPESSVPFPDPRFPGRGFKTGSEPEISNHIMT